MVVGIQAFQTNVEQQVDQRGAWHVFGQSPQAMIDTHVLAKTHIRASCASEASSVPSRSGQ